MTPQNTSVAIAITRAGEVDYERALEIQRTIHQEVASRERTNTLMLLEHPSVYTAGKRTSAEELPTNGAKVISVDRGGKITWHGPGQLVGYPIVRLAQRHELVGFVRALEGALINVCREFSIEADRIKGRSGVWVGDRKIAAIGIRVAQGVTMHGFALNVCPDLSAFEEIIPCGIADADVTSMERELARKVSIDEVSPIVERHIYDALMEVSA